jgi:hypothetical protein
MPCGLTLNSVITFYIYIFDNKLTSLSESSAVVKVPCCATPFGILPVKSDATFINLNGLQLPRRLKLKESPEGGKSKRYPEPLSIYYCPHSMCQKSPPNKALRQWFTSHNGREPNFSWFGPVLVMKHMDEKSANFSTNEFSSDDIVHLSEYFLSEGM